MPIQRAFRYDIVCLLQSNSHDYTAISEGHPDNVAPVSYVCLLVFDIVFIYFILVLLCVVWGKYYDINRCFFLCICLLVHFLLYNSYAWDYRYAYIETIKYWGVHINTMSRSSTVEHDG